MDEPLSNLDAKLRVEMRNAIKRIQQQVGITTLYVTHDQEEALAVSDRIAVMNGGVIQQIDTPKNIYQRPANLFVSTFIGLSNIMDGTVDTVSYTHLDVYKRQIISPPHSTASGFSPWMAGTSVWLVQPNSLLCKSDKKTIVLSR